MGKRIRYTEEFKLGTHRTANKYEEMEGLKSGLCGFQTNLKSSTYAPFNES